MVIDKSGVAFAQIRRPQCFGEMFGAIWLIGASGNLRQDLPQTAPKYQRLSKSDIDREFFGLGQF